MKQITRQDIADQSRIAHSAIEHGANAQRLGELFTNISVMVLACPDYNDQERATLFNVFGGAAAVYLSLVALEKQK